MKKFFGLLLFCLILLLAGVFVWYHLSTAAVDSKNTGTQVFTVHKGETLYSIANRLEQAHLIKNAGAFVWLIKIEHLGNKIQAGDFRLSPSLNSEQLANMLTHGSEDIWITVPEGKRAEEIAAILQNKMPQFTDNWRDVLLQNEGYLFPETYSFPHDATIDSIVQTMTTTFNQRYAELPINTNLTQEQVVILASLVEREGKTDADRPLIASVFYNRLKLGMPLQVDATVQYALGYNDYEHTWWKKDLTYDDLQIKSPFNTYLNTGLPPSPICNPGQKALEAAANPPTTTYLYYLADKEGITHFASTLAEHNANIKKYGL